MRWFWRFFFSLTLKSALCADVGRIYITAVEFKWIEGCDINSLTEYCGSDRAMRSGKAAE